MFVSPKMAAILKFFEKFAKHKNAYILKTVLDRAISTKFLSHRVSLEWPFQFLKNLVLPKMAANFKFLNFSQKLETKYLYLKNRAR